MTDIALKWLEGAQGADVTVMGHDLTVDDGLETAVIVSLFTDRRASKDDVIPDGSTDRRGWWGDGFTTVEGDEIGSKLWLLERSTITAETLRRFKDYAAEALKWFVTDGIAKRIEVTVERRAIDQVAMLVTITKPDGSIGKYDYIWKGLA